MPTFAHPASASAANQAAMSQVVISFRASNPTTAIREEASKVEGASATHLTA
jgi:hypothetical protein